MGGRGASSGVGASSSTATRSPSSLNDSQLNSAISYTNTELKRVGSQVDRLSERITEARMSPRDGRSARVDKAISDYNKAQKTYNELRDRKTALENERDKRRRSKATTSASARPFVNSFGEATTRVITTRNYEQAQRKLERQIATLLGRR